MPLFKSDYAARPPNHDSILEAGGFGDMDEPSRKEEANSFHQRLNQEALPKCSTEEELLPNRVPNLQDYTIKDDEEVTSSEDEGGFQRAVSESSIKSWFNRSRHSRSSTLSSHKHESSPIAPTTPLDESSQPDVDDATNFAFSPSKSATPSKRSFRSFFRRDHDSDVDSSHYDTTEEDIVKVGPKRDENDENSSALGVRLDPVTPENVSGTPAGSARFWRGWRHSHSGTKTEKELPTDDELIDSNTLTKEQKREKNLIKLTHQLSDVSIRQENCLNEVGQSTDTDIDRLHQEDADSTSSSLERASRLKEKIDAVFSASPEGRDEISPITPPTDSTDNPYKYVFEQATVLGNHMVYDHAWLDKYSISFCNFDSALKLLTNDLKSLPSLFERSNITVSEISKELLDFVKSTNCKLREVEKENMILQDELTALKDNCGRLKNEIDLRDASSKNLSSSIEELNNKCHNLVADVEIGKKMNNDLEKKLEDLKAQKKTIKNHHKNTIKQQETEIRNLRKEKDSKDSLITTYITEKDSLRSEICNLQKEMQDMIVKHEVLQEKQVFTSSQLSIFLEKEKTQKAVDCREVVKNLELSTGMKNRYENTIGLLKVGNMKIQENFNNERRKVLDLRREKKTLQKRIDLIDCYRSQSLQFMSHLMLYYRGIVSDQVLSDFDNHLKILDASYSSVAGKLEDPVLETKLRDCQLQVSEFFNEFALHTFLDQIVTKHVSYMRSNNFLSSQLAGLRKQINDYEQYVNRLLKEINERKNLQRASQPGTCV